MLQIAFSLYRAKTAKMVTSVSLAKIGENENDFRAPNRYDFAIVSLSGKQLRRQKICCAFSTFLNRILQA